MPTPPHQISIIRDLDSQVPPPKDFRRRRIAGRLLGIGDKVHIIQLGYNGTILDFTPSKILVLPHDYGYPDLYLSLHLWTGVGISALQRVQLEELGVYYFDHTLLDKGTYPAPSRRFQTVHRSYEWKDDKENIHCLSE